MNLESYRSEIDLLDKQLAELFLKRLDAVEGVAREKIKSGAPVLDPEREKKVLSAAAADAPEKFSGYLGDFMNSVMDLSKKRQREMMRAAGLSAGNPFLQLLSRITAEAKQPHVVVQGVNGSYSSKAAGSMYPGGSISYVDRWEDVFWEISSGNAQYGILPVENSTAGSVTEVYELLLRNSLFIVKTADLRIRHCLLGVRGASLNEITEVYSHPHAFPQCTGFFRNYPRIRKIPTLNTALASKLVALEGDRHKAALSSADCAHLYGLDILSRGIEDNPVNCTRFISISKKLELPEDANKISILFSLPHVTGSLYRLLGRFALNGLNITKIESRPNPEKPFEYYFYLDFLGALRSRHVVDLLSSLSEELPGFYFFGNYNEQEPEEEDL